jgi:hypothetical protein
VAFLIWRYSVIVQYSVNFSSGFLIGISSFFRIKKRALTVGYELRKNIKFVFNFYLLTFEALILSKK